MLVLAPGADNRAMRRRADEPPTTPTARRAALLIAVGVAGLSALWIGEIVYQSVLAVWGVRTIWVGEPFIACAACGGAAIYVTVRAIRWVRAEGRRLQSRCAECGDQLDGGTRRCPECGAAARDS